MVNSGKTMKALLLRKHGGRDDLEVVSDYPVPRAADGHVEVADDPHRVVDERVHAV